MKTHEPHWRPAVDLSPRTGPSVPPIYVRDSPSSSRPSSPTGLPLPASAYTGSLSTALAPTDVIRATDLSHSLHIPELVEAVLALPLTKAAVSLSVLERLIFLRAPDTEIALDDEGKDGHLSGLLNIVSPKRRLVKSISVSLIGQQRLAFSRGSLKAFEDDEFFRKELIVEGSNGEGIWLKQGISTFEFSVSVPASSPVIDRNEFDVVQYIIRGKVHGLGSSSFFFGGTDAMVDEKKIGVISAPGDRSRVFHVRQEVIAPEFGPYRLEMASSELIVACALSLALSLSDPPPTLSIYSIDVFLHQDYRLASLRDPARVEHVRGPRLYVCQDGVPGESYGSKGFLEKARKSGKILLDGRRKRNGQAFWMWQKVARLPNDLELRPTTPDGTRTCLRFSSELSFEIAFNESPDAPVKVATLYCKTLALGSCHSMLPILSLPGYADQATPGRWRDDGNPGCLCDLSWEEVQRSAVKLMRDNVPEEGREAPGPSWLEPTSGGGSGSSLRTPSPAREGPEKREWKQAETFDVVERESRKKLS